MQSSLHTTFSKTGDVEFGDPIIYRGQDVKGHHGGVDALYDYYISVKARAGGRPQRRHIHPADFKTYLPNIVLINIDTLDPLVLRVRLAGTHVSSVYGEITGDLIENLSNTAAIDRINRMSALSIETDQPILCITPGLAPDIKHLIAVAMYAPLYDDAGTPNMIFTAVFVEKLSAEQQIAMMSRS